ncbi:10203_t:CDS:1, partial [Entrophospora sp. SA101]
LILSVSVLVQLNAVSNEVSSKLAQSSPIKDSHTSVFGISRTKFVPSCCLIVK